MAYRFWVSTFVLEEFDHNIADYFSRLDVVAFDQPFYLFRHETNARGPLLSNFQSGQKISQRKVIRTIETTTVLTKK